MHSKVRFQDSIFGPSLSPVSAALAMMLLLLFLILPVALMNLAALPAQAQTLTLLHSFTAGQDGAEPYAGLTMDRAGNLYGTALGGGCGYGTVFKMTHKSNGWLFNPLYCFAGGNDGNAPVARVVFGPDGSLYGTTQFGGGNGCSGGFGCGTVFRLRPPATACKTALCPWSETVLHRFAEDGDGGNPSYVILSSTGRAICTALHEAGAAMGVELFSSWHRHRVGNGQKALFTASPANRTGQNLWPV